MIQRSTIPLCGALTLLALGTAAQRQEINLPGREPVTDVYSIDLDRDTDTDFVTAEYQTGAISWWENNGAESFTRRVAHSGLAGAVSVVAGDLDGDTDLDIAAVGHLSNQVIWLQNQGSQTFQAHVIAESVVGAHQIAIWDADEDGDLDLLVAAIGAHSVIWWENSGLGTFSPHTVTSDFAGASAVDPFDLDQDGDLDIVACAFEAGELAWWENDGEEVFTKRLISADASDVIDIAVADFDNSGSPDVATAHWIYDNTFQNFNIVENDPLEGDLSWWQNDGQQQFSRHPVRNGEDGWRSVRAGDSDWNGRGHVDLICSAYYELEIPELGPGVRYFSASRLFSNAGPPNFLSGSTGTSGITGPSQGFYSVGGDIVDVDGDTDVDFVVIRPPAFAWFQVLSPPTATEATPALGVVVTGPSIDPEGETVTYFYRWRSTGGDDLTHGPTTSLTDVLSEVHLVDGADRWSVEIQPYDGSQFGQATVVEFSSPEQEVTFDLNEDGNVDAADVVTLINEILGSP